MNRTIGISNIEILEFCKSNLETGEKNFKMIILNWKNLMAFILWIKKTFFAIFLSDAGTKIYF